MNSEVPVEGRRYSPPAVAPALKALASVQLAVALLGLYVAVLVWGTMIESQQGAPAAHFYVYGARWFTALNVLLAVNVLCAMLVRLPWRRRQTGFVAVHAGILVLLAGCLATKYWGIEAQLPVYEGQASHVAADDSHRLDIGFQVYLRQFRRKLDPGTGMASHYSSLVDFLDLSDPPKKLQENVLITLNAPVDFADPKTGRTYRLFQSSFEGPLLPGDPEFDQLVGSDHSRDQLYLSQFTVNYDPGRGLKYAGCLMIIVGIGLVYYSKTFGRKGPGARGHGSGGRVVGALLVLLFLAGAGLAEDRPELDWSVWRHLPTFGQGRVTPLDSYARETVEAICGRAEPTLELEHGQWQKCTAAELLFRWLVEPEKWENIPFLVAQDEQLRQEVMGLPLLDADGRRLRYASPIEVENNAELGRRWAELQRREEAEGKDFRLVGVEKSIKNLVEAYGKYRQLTFNLKSPKAASQRFYGRVRTAGGVLGKLAGDLHAARRISRDKEVREATVKAGNAMQALIAQIHGNEFALEKVEPLVAAFCRAADQLAALLTDSSDKPTAALAADLRRQAAEMHLALYDNGEALRLVPALNAGALEENRTPGDDASPWLSFQAMLFGSDDLLAAYPQPQLRAVCKAFAEVKAAYLDRGATDRPAKFAAAMDRFADALRALGEKIEPLRAKLPIQHRDQTLIDLTAYPPPGSTDVEVFYNRLDPFFWSWVVSLAATLCLLLAVGRARKPMFWLGVTVLLAAQGFTAAGLGLRGYITGLVPLTGMFETVVFVALYAGLLGLWFSLKPLLWLSVPLLGTSSADLMENGKHRLFQAVAHGRIDHVFQRRLFVVAGAIVSFVAAVLAYYAPASVMHRNIGAATPILRDNFWLAVHVVTIMASYASAAIALILGNVALGYYLFGRYGQGGTFLGGTSLSAVKGVASPPQTTPFAPLRDVPPHKPPETCAVLAGFIYTAIQITVLLLAAGTVLGAGWADKAWGRFWAWDPKEVWALISLLAYLLLLHARHCGWSGDFGMAVTAVFGFTAILFTWYGVNFLLGSGMHSYGSGAGGIWPVVAAVVCEWLFLAAAAGRFLGEESQS